MKNKEANVHVTQAIVELSFKVVNNMIFSEINIKLTIITLNVINFQLPPNTREGAKGNNQD